MVDWQSLRTLVPLEVSALRGTIAYYRDHGRLELVRHVCLPRQG